MPFAFFVVPFFLILGGSIISFGVLLLVYTVLAIIPRTAVLGTILLTGYFGGAIASHVRGGNPIVALVFPIMLSAMLWGGLYLVDARVLAVFLLSEHA
ncbi:DoxX family protein [Herpetosiphon sp. NSE202]|uniref:DoxX family protein n=1 Tax=Herpetosiphon sp. NSE202 TaxID=3351349 RepID=UPI0036307D36